MISNNYFTSSQKAGTREMASVTYDNNFSLFFEIGPNHKEALVDYFKKLDELEIQYDITGGDNTWNPMLCDRGDCVFSVNQIKKVLDTIIASR